MTDNLLAHVRKRASLTLICCSLKTLIITTLSFDLKAIFASILDNGPVVAAAAVATAFFTGVRLVGGSFLDKRRGDLRSKAISGGLFLRGVL